MLVKGSALITGELLGLIVQGKIVVRVIDCPDMTLAVDHAWRKNKKSNIIPKRSTTIPDQHKSKYELCN